MHRIEDPAIGSGFATNPKTRETVCLFCGDKASEEFFSGSYETYLECGCAQREQYREALKRLEETRKLPLARKVLFEATEEMTKADERKRWAAQNLSGCIQNFEEANKQE